MIKNFFLIFVLIIFFPNFSSAVSNDFWIKTQIGNDITPPTTPTLLSVVPVASSQIDLAWSASTDEFLLGGYVLLRDGSPLATTTLTTFSDTALTPETLYSYEVYAFDNSYNLSTTSNSLATITLALPIIPPVATSTEPSPAASEQSIRTFILRDFTINAGIYNADFKWRTDGLSSYSLRWGKTNDYNEGYIINDTFSELHQTNLSALEADTVYLYELVGYSPYGASKILKQGQFKTEVIKKITSPQNVLRLNAQVQNDDVLLTWQLPLSVPIASVRVVSSHLGYPSDINDGAIVYEGLGVEVKDKNVLKTYSSQYYTVFVIDVDGNVSSGAVVAVSKSSSALDVDSKSVPAITSTSPATSTKVIKEIAVLGFDVSNINILQNDVNFNFLTEKIALSYQDSFVISIPFKSLPDHLKSIVVTLLDPTDHHRSYSFLLKINKDKTAYEATIAPLNVLGVSRMQVEIFDFEKKVIGLYRKQIDFEVSNNSLKDTEVVFPDKIVDSFKKTTSIFLVVGLMTFVLIFLWWLGKRRGEDN